MITEEHFKAFRQVQNEGDYNMIMDAEAAAREIGVTRTEYLDILKNYGKYMNQFNIK